MGYYANVYMVVQTQVSLVCNDERIDSLVTFQIEYYGAKL